jgi:hypothetical protein
MAREWRDQSQRVGGDQRSRRIEKHHEAIMNAIETKPHVTLVEIAEMLASEQGAPTSGLSGDVAVKRVRPGTSTIARCFPASGSMGNCGASCGVQYRQCCPSTCE